MKIKRIINGATEWLASAPISVLGEDGETIDHVETSWTADEAHAKDFTSRVPTAQHARDIAAQLAGFPGVVLPPEFATLPEPAPRPAAPLPPPPVKFERYDTPEGIALRERLAAERAAKEAAEAKERAEKRAGGEDPS